MSGISHATSNLLNLSGQSVLVTGASGNIGAGIAKTLAAAGAEVIAHYRSGRSQVDLLVQEIVDSGGQASSIQADLQSESDIRQLVGAVQNLTGVVNNAALQPVVSLSDMSMDDWRSVMEANLDGVFLLCRLAAERMADGGGAFVNIASIEGLDPAVGHAHYSASKAGLIMLTRSIAAEYGEKGIRANAVSPGLIDREGLLNEWPEGVERWHAKAPLTRMGMVDDVANAVLFLLSPAATWISGSNLVVDGGMSAISRW